MAIVLAPAEHTVPIHSPAGAGLAVGCSIEEMYYSVFGLQLTLLVLLIDRLHLHDGTHGTARTREEHLLTFGAWHWVTPLTYAQGSTLNATTACEKG